MDKKKVISNGIGYLCLKRRMYIVLYTKIRLLYSVSLIKEGLSSASHYSNAPQFWEFSGEIFRAQIPRGNH